MNTKNIKLETVGKSVRHLFLIVMIIMIVGEILESLFVKALPPFLFIDATMIDSILMLIIIFPILNYLVFRPFKTIIAEQEQSEEALKKSEEKFRHLVESTNDIIFTLDTEQQHTGVYGSWVEQSGMTAEMFLGKTAREILKDNNTELHETMNQRALSGEFVTYEWSTGTKEHPMVIQTKLSPVKDSAGAIYGIVGIGRNITEHKQLETMLNLNSEILKNLAEGIFLIRLEDGMIVFTNKRFEKMFGYEPGEMIGKNVSIVNAPTDKDPEETTKLIIDILVKTGEWHGEIRNIRKDGTHFWCNANVSMFDHHEYGRVFVSVHSDITERKQAEEKLRQLSQAVEQSPATIVITDTNGTIQYVNHKFIELTGYSLEEAIGRNPRILKSGETSPDEYKKLWQVLIAGEEWHGKFHNRKKNGDLYWESATISPIINARGETTHYLAVKEDITERKKFEEEIVASRDQLRELALRMEQIREEERTTIAREIHDELGQNLTGLKMNLTWLTKKLNADEKLRERVFRMRDLVDTTILEVRRIATELRPGILDELGLGAAMAWHGKKFEEGSGIECIIDIDPQIEKISQGCSTAVFRIFQEALTNVGRHSEATLVKTKLSVLNDGLYLEISDNGLGIDSAKLNDRTSIGLLGMKERALALGGEVTIARLPDSGTKITATIPL